MSSAHLTKRIPYSPEVETAAASIVDLLRGEYPIPLRALALLILQNDNEMFELARRVEGDIAADKIRHILNELNEPEMPIAYRITLERQAIVNSISEKFLVRKDEKKQTFSQFIGRITMHPFWGLPILLFVVYVGLYWFVGVFGGGVVVGFLEEKLFGEWINPSVVHFVKQYVPWQSLQDLLVGEFGIWTLGITYAVALILPIVGLFFLVFSILEDSGYLPRLAMLVDRVFKIMGLNGRAVIPIVLGFGCDTMATMVTRVLETRRERIIATILLSLAIPCSAQLSVILTLLAHHPKAIVVWAGVLTSIFLIAGLLASKIVVGQPAGFFLEIPPLRLPSLKNVVMKTVSRLQSYFFEVFPLFISASVIIWLGQIIGLFDFLLKKLTPAVVWIGLPKESAVAFLFGFFRRDYGVAGLFSVDKAHALTANQLLISSVMLTLFLPCIAQLLMVKKERGWKMALGMIVVTLGSAFVIGLAVSRILSYTGIQL